MLVLGRRVGEKIQIGADIVITVLEARGDNVRIGIDAPRSVAVARSEVITVISDSNRSAASASEGIAADEWLRLLDPTTASRSARRATT